MEKRIILDDFTVRYLGNRIYELTAKGTAGVGYYIATGAAVTSILKLPHNHRLLKVELKHTNLTESDSIDALTWSLHRQLDGAFIELIDYVNSTLSNFVWEFNGESFVYPNMTYKFIQNTTITDRIRLKITIQLTE